MINENTIIFGHGDIEVSSSICGLTFYELTEPMKIGIYDEELIVLKRNTMKSSVFIPLLTLHECSKFSILLEKVERREINRFTFCGYIFDFSKFNNESIDVCKKNLDNIITK